MTTHDRAGWCLMRRHRNKTYFRIPGGEIQHGHLSRSIVVWFHGRRYIVRRGNA